MNKFQMIATLIVGLASEMDSFNTDERKRSFLAGQGVSTLDDLARRIGTSIWEHLAANKAAQVALRSSEIDRFMAAMEKYPEDSRVSDIQKNMFLEMVKFFVKNYERDGKTFNASTPPA